MFTSTSPETQSGSFILEALVSVLIFAIGLIALMGMAGQAVNQVGQTKFRNDASNLAGELTGQMWVGTATLVDFAIDEAADPNVDCPNDNAGTAAVAWLTRTKSVLPTGCATVIITVGAGADPATQVDIDISWADSKNINEGVRHHYRTSTQIAKNPL
jgi:type IV pilus assembly protein PilV